MACSTTLLTGIAFMAIGLAGTILAGKPHAQTTPVLFFVSTRGNDSWSGRTPVRSGKDGPFATVTRARDAVRAWRRDHSREGRPVRVILGGGTYFLAEPVELGPEDSGTEAAPVVYAAAPGETVTLSGGRRLPAGRWGEVNGRHAWTVDLPEVKSGAWWFRQLFVDGGRRPRTRLPRTGTYPIESLPGYDPAKAETPGYAFLDGTREFVYRGTDLRPWRNLRDVEVIGITRWIDNRLPIESVDPERRLVRFDRKSLFTLADLSEKPSVYWVENVLEALGTPGQWYLDRSGGRLGYLPRDGEDPAGCEIIAPRLTQVVRLVGRDGAPVHDVRFEGLHFAHTEWQPPADWSSSLQAATDVPGALSFDWARRCSVRGCFIEHTGTYGIEVGVGCSDLDFSRNRLTDLGAGGIRIGHFFSYEPNERGRKREAAMPRGEHSERITISDNVIAQGGRVTAAGVGVFVGDNAGNKVVYNDIFDLKYSGISVGSVQDFGPNHAARNVIEHNHVHQIGDGTLSDLAGIYTCSCPESRIAHNVIHDVVRREYGGWGIYPDEGSHNLLIRENLVYRCQDGGLFAHHNHDVTADNNIFAFNTNAQVDRGGVGGFELTCRRNLIVCGEGKAIGGYGSARIGTDVCLFDQNLYWSASGGPPRFGDRSLAEWQAAGQDLHSIVADPGFTAAERGDFTLRAGSPASRIGFHPWALSDVGPRSPKGKVW